MVAVLKIDRRSASFRTRTAPRTVRESMGRVMPRKVEEFDVADWGRLIHLDVKALIIKGVKMKDIAEQTGLCQKTIHNLVYDPRPYPRHRTIVLMMLYLGYELIARKKA